MIEPTNAEQILLRLEWQVIRKLDGILQGDYRTLFYGEGLDFADLREYVLEDDIRHIDWNVTARTDSLHVRQYTEEREITAWFLLDMSPSMAFGLQGHTKQQVLIELVTLLARLLTRNGNRVGAIVYRHDQLHTIRPAGGRRQVLRLAHELLRSSDGASESITDLNVLLNTGLNTFFRRSLVFLISDFISKPGWIRALSVLNKRNDLIGIHLWDPREVELPNAGWIVVEDGETGEQLTLDTGDPIFQRRFFDAARRREAALRENLEKAGVDHYSVSTEDELVRTIVRMVEKRKHRFR